MNLTDISPSDRTPTTPINENFDAIDYSAVFAKRHAATEALNWAYRGGRWSGFSIAAGAFTLSDNATNYIVVQRTDGVTSASTSATNWNNPIQYARIYKLTTASGVVTVEEDHRAGVNGIHGPAADVAVSTSNVGNVGSGEDNLITYLLSQFRITTTFCGLRITAWGITANNANAKTLKMYFGSQVILTFAFTTSQANTWRAVAEVFSTGTDAQDYVAQLTQAGTASGSDVESGTATQDDGAAITIKCTGEATADNDIVQQGMLVELLRV